MSVLELLSLETGASSDVLQRIVATAPRRYKVYPIAKRNGGIRLIAHPARELKLLQRIFLEHVLNKVPTSDVAMAYVSGRGIVLNARHHLNQPWILKLDFKDFFHSIVPADWDRIVRQNPALVPYTRDRAVLHRILFWGKEPKQNVPTCLSIGAPTSPAVSNLACAVLDKWLAEKARVLGLNVTRYADDITVSGSNPQKLLRFEADLTIALGRNRGLTLQLNEKKRGLYGPGERRMVTGLILTPDGSVSIGRERKRLISALIHRFSVGSLGLSEAMRAKGLLAFAHAAEPSFLLAMKSKYGENVLTSLSKVGPSDLLAAHDIEF